ncbi:hypothetical protein H6775_03740 [Candidatus Nomurabacteria bacterium]|nr:hypothetical protein [Candidatus Nomurabacteria bacterium]
MFPKIREETYAFLFGYKTSLPSLESIQDLSVLECKELIDIIVSNTERSIFNGSTSPSLINDLVIISAFLSKLNERVSPCTTFSTGIQF